MLSRWNTRSVQTLTLLVLALLALTFAGLAACSPAPTPTPPLCERHPNLSQCQTPTPAPTLTAEQAGAELRDQRRRATEQCNRVDEARRLYRTMVDDYLEYGDQITEDGVITESEGQRMRDESARTKRQLQAISTAERRCDDARQRVRELEGVLSRIPMEPTATPTSAPTATPGPAPTPTLTTAELTRQRRVTATASAPTPTPTRTPVPSICETQPQYCPTPTPEATPTPTPGQWLQRYQVFADDIAFVRGSEVWEYQQRPYTPVDVCRRILSSDPRYQDCATRRIFTELGNAAELERRYQLLKHQPESEQAKHWPGICRDIDDQVYIPILYSAVVESGPSFLLDQRHSRFLGWHAGHLRLYLTESCAEHVPYEPYPEPPDLDCANYDYREDAEEDAYTYWYADDIKHLLDYEYSSTWGTTTELICGYLPSRP